MQKRLLTERKAWTMSAFIELSGLSLITTKICSSFSRLMKLPNQDFLASLQSERNMKHEVFMKSSGDTRSILIRAQNKIDPMALMQNKLILNNT